MSKFSHLHLHTHYSFLDGAIHEEELMKHLVNIGQTACAVTDHGSGFGAYKFHTAARRHGIKPILGVEAYFDPTSRFVRDSTYKQFHLILLAKSRAGWKNIVQIISEAHLSGLYYKPRIDPETLRKHSDDVICLTACLGSYTADRYRLDGMQGLDDTICLLKHIFGENLYLELQANGLEEQHEYNNALYRYAAKQNLSHKLVVTNDAHYLYASDARPHDCLMAISMDKDINDPDRLSHGAIPRYWVKSAEEMQQGLDSRLHEFLATSQVIVDQIEDYDFPTDYRFPHFTVPDNYSMEGWFVHATLTGFEKREQKGEIPCDTPSWTIYRKRLHYELSIIKRMKYASYFLIVSDFINHARHNNIPVGPGRGSGAGSLVAYCLGITDVDPVRHNLLFERFLNPDRVSMPDFDIDFCRDRREEVVQYLVNKYGHERVAHICTFSTLKPRSAIQSVGKSMGYNYKDQRKVMDLIPDAEMGFYKSLDTYIAESPALQELEATNTYRELFSISRRLEGLSRHNGIHAAGVILSNEDISSIVPCFRGKDSDTIVAQADMQVLERLGFIKFDILGLTTLTHLEKCKTLLRADENYDEPDMSLADPSVYQLLASGRTAGIFQLESHGIRDLMRRLEPDTFEHIVACLALYRPGPLEGGMVEEFIRRKKNPERVEYAHPKLENILSNSYGVIIYQEQVMQIASDLAGYTLAHADLLRRAMGKKKIEAMDAEKVAFLQGCQHSGIDTETSEYIWEQMAKFAKYGFNRSHSVAYAMISYATAYYKAKYPAYFYAALLEVADTTDKMKAAIHNAKSDGLRVVPPQYGNLSYNFTTDGEQIFFGLKGIKGLGNKYDKDIWQGAQSIAEYMRDPRSEKQKQFITALAAIGSFRNLESDS